MAHVIWNVPHNLLMVMNAEDAVNPESIKDLSAFSDQHTIDANTFLSNCKEVVLPNTVKTIEGR